MDIIQRRELDVKGKRAQKTIMVGQAPPYEVRGKAGARGAAELTDIVYIDGGFEHSLAIDKDGRIWVWGRNEQGQLGLGRTQPEQEVYAVKLPN